jgi:single-stranded-DNA-specific exonuclease
MTPIFLTAEVKDTGYGKPMGKENEHIKLFVKQNGSEGIPAIGFGLGDKYELTANQKSFQMAYCIDENEWNGQTSIQLRLKSIK